METFKVIGLNCGTSVDGIDVAEILISSIPDTSDVTISLVSYREHPVPSKLQARVRSLCRPGVATTLEEICDLNFEIGEIFAEAVLESGIDMSTVDLISSHGQTLWHTPVARNAGKGYNSDERRMSTLQMGESSVMTRKTGITMADNFRVSELAHGRMGAPLAGFFETALLRHPTKTRVSQNLGGMGNATVIPSSASPLAPGYLAFDTGPGNVLIDAVVRTLSNGSQEFDKNGEMAKAGMSEIDMDFIERYLASVDYLSWEPPKTTGRELFSDDMAKRLLDELQAKGLSNDGIVANITQITIETVVRALQDFIVPTYGNIDELFICGGGAENPVVFKGIKDRFPESVVAKFGDATGHAISGDTAGAKANGHSKAEVRGTGLPVHAKEAVMFGLCGYLCVHGRSVPISMGEKHKEQSVMGKITPGKNFADLMRRAQKTGNNGTLDKIFVQ